MKTSKRNFWLTPNGLAAIALIAGVLYFLLSEHRAHTLYLLPFLILLLCPVMHMFMHRDHDDHGGHNGTDAGAGETEDHEGHGDHRSRRINNERQ